MLRESNDSKLILIILEVLKIDFRPEDSTFINDSHLFPILRSVMTRADDFSKLEEKKVLVSEKAFVSEMCEASPEDVAVTASSSNEQAIQLLSADTMSFWDSSPGGGGMFVWILCSLNSDDQPAYTTEHKLTFKFSKPRKLSGISFYVDSERDTPAKCFTIGTFDVTTSSDLKLALGSLSAGPPSTGFITFSFSSFKDGKNIVGIDEWGNLLLKEVVVKVSNASKSAFHCRIRKVKFLVNDNREILVNSDSVPFNVSESALSLFRSHFNRFFATTSKSVKLIDNASTAAPELIRANSLVDLQQQLTAVVFDKKSSCDSLDDFQKTVFGLIISELEQEVVRIVESGTVLNYEAPPVTGDLVRELSEANRCALAAVSEPDENCRSLASDNYIYELVCMAEILSGNKAGQLALTTPTVINGLVSLFSRASSRLQRALLRIFARILPLVKPDTIVLKFMPNIHVVQMFLLCAVSCVSVTIRSLESDLKCTAAINKFKDVSLLQFAEAERCLLLLRQLSCTELWCLPIQAFIVETMEWLGAWVNSNLSFESVVSNGAIADEVWKMISIVCFVAVPFIHELPSALKSLLVNSFIAVDSDSGNGKAKVSVNGQARLIVATDLKNGKAAVEIRVIRGSERCRFCSEDLSDVNTTELSLSQNCCNSEVCLDTLQKVCSKILVCGHSCNGLKDEQNCLPCLNSSCSSFKSLKTRQDKDDICNVCWTESLHVQPCIQLECGHIFHYDCISTILKGRWNGARITFGFMNCPLCGLSINHEALKLILEPLQKLLEEVKSKSLLRLSFDGLEKHVDIITQGGKYYQDPAGFAMHRYAYYQCFKCSKPYFGGLYECAAAAPVHFDASELLCGSCNPLSSQECPKHGKDYLEFKCRFCCSVSVWFCFGTTHFCDSCHNNHYNLTNKDIKDLMPCPCVSKSSQMPTKLEGKCPLNVEHPASGIEFCLGCGVCRNVSTF